MYETMGYIIRGDPNRNAVSRNDPDMMDQRRVELHAIRACW